MRKALSLTTLHNSFANVGDAPVGVGEVVGWESRFMSAIQFLDAEERLTSDIIGVDKLDVWSPSTLVENKIRNNRKGDNEQTYGQ